MISVSVTDVGGRMKSLEARAKREARAAIYDAIERSAFALAQRMRAQAPVGPDQPHIRDGIATKRRGLVAQVGFLEPGPESRPGSGWHLADVALFNEYQPNKQPFMRPAAEAEANDFGKRVRAAITLMERDLSGGGGLL